ncbi:MAG: hypothetical protein E7310_06240 [Clostridiales bacterium]|nr:hypothetical protein [Clostridiales bacterium]
MPRSLIDVLHELAAKEETSKLIGERLAAAVQSNHENVLNLQAVCSRKACESEIDEARKAVEKSKESVEKLTKAHNNLYHKIQELIEEKRERITRANKFIKEHSEELYSNDGVKSTESIPIIDIIYVISFDSADVQFKGMENKWFALGFLPTENDEDMTAIRIRKSN